MSARIPAASYKSLIRISVERGPLNQMDATVDLNYYPRPESHRQRGSKRFKVLCKLPPTFTFSSPATGASSAAIAVTKQILCLPRVVLEDVRAAVSRAAETEIPALEFRVESSTTRKGKKGQERLSVFGRDVVRLTTLSHGTSDYLMVPKLNGDEMRNSPKVR